MDEPDESWPRARREKHTPRPHLRIAGPASIAETLLTTAGVTGAHVTQYMCLFDDMIAL